MLYDEEPKTLDYKTPKCTECDEFSRPHVLFHDEDYDNKLYYMNKVKNFIYNMDGLIVCGNNNESYLSDEII